MAANYVPAAAVIRRPQALSGIIGRKEMRRCPDLVFDQRHRHNLCKVEETVWIEGDRGRWNFWWSSEMR